MRLSSSKLWVLCLSVGLLAACGEPDPLADGGVEHDGGVDGGEGTPDGGSDAGTEPVDGGEEPTDGGTGDGGTEDLCPAPHGVSWVGRQRFVYGYNWGWQRWGADFGGVSAWNAKGVSQDPATYRQALGQMKEAGVSVVRWWMFPRFLTESIEWGSDGAPVGIAGTLTADVQKALELAEEQDVYLMLTPFSFDSFYPTANEGGILARSLRPMVVNATLRAKLLENLIKPIAQAVESSPYRHRMIAWDLINEPEWATTGANPYGGEDFDPQLDLDLVTHAQMELFLQELTATLRANSNARITVGGAAIKWGTAWQKVDLDFDQVHIYDWIYQWYPYTEATLESLGLTKRPMVMGEYPSDGLSAIPSRNLPARTLPQLVGDLWDHGYAGALGWAFNDSNFPWDPLSVKAGANLHPCESRY